MREAVDSEEGSGKMFEIDNFAAGIIPNAAWSGFRNVAAMDWKNLRVDPNGFLIQRDGHHTLFTDEGVSQVYIYRTLILAIADEELKWGRVQAGDEPVDLNSFDPVKTVDIQGYYHFESISVAGREQILLGNGYEIYCVDLKDTFDSTPGDPVIVPYVLSAPIYTSIDRISDGKTSGEEFTREVTAIVLQTVQVVGNQDAPLDQLEFGTDNPLEEIAPKIAVSPVSPIRSFSVATGDVADLDEDVVEDPARATRRRVSSSPDADEFTLDTTGGTDEYELVMSDGDGLVDGFFEDLEDDIPVEFRSVMNARWTGTVTSVSESDGVGTVTLHLPTRRGSLNINGTTTINFFTSGGTTGTSVHTRISIRLDTDSLPQPVSPSEFETLVDREELFVDVYRAPRQVIDEFRYGEVSEFNWYFVGRFPYQLGEDVSVNYDIPVDDNDLDDGEELVLEGAPLHWAYLEQDEFRVYATGLDSDELYLSYFDGISERLYRNFTDTIKLNLGGETVTGIKFLEDNYLAVYTPHRILLVYTDPAPELTRVQGRYSQGPRDESVGCIAPRSLVEVDEYHFFLSPNKRIYRFGGRRPSWVSASVQPILEPLTLADIDESRIPLSEAVAVSYLGSYYLSFPSIEEEYKHFVQWKGDILRWKADRLEWKQDFFKPNTTLIYDIDRDKWYRDGFGVESYSKDVRDRLYGIVDGNIVALYGNDDPDEDIEWEWHSNYLMMPPRTNIFNVTVKTQNAVDINVTVRTEEGEQTRELSADDANDYWGQYAGFNLRGRTARLSITGTGRTTIDRITINEEVR